MSAAWLAPLRARWDQTSPREQAALRVAMAVLLLASLWAVALRPAWTALRSAQAQAAQVHAQYIQVLQWQAQAQALRAQATAPGGDPRALLQASIATLGPSARLVTLGAQLECTFQDADGAALAQWLTQARLQARTRPLEAHITQSGGRWSGRLLLQLPAAP